MADTPKGRATRARILDAAWELSDARGAEAILGGVTLRELAAAVDMAPSAVSYHFPTLRELSVAMVEHLADSVSLLPVDAVDELLAQAIDEGLAAVIRLAAQSNWDLLTCPEEVDFERRLTRCYSLTGESEDNAEIRRLIGSMTSMWIGDLATIYRRTTDGLGLQLIEPFTFDELARGAAALTEGLIYQWISSPESVRSELVADLLVALVSAVLVPAPGSVALAERAAELPGRAPRQHGDGDAEMRLAERAAPLFLEGVHHVTLTETARQMGIEPSAAAESFGSVPMVAALSFSRHLPAVASAVDRRRQAGAAISLTDGVYELARCALGDRHCALALAHQRHLAAAGMPALLDVRELVPLAAVVASPMADLLDAAPTDVIELGDLVVDTVLTQAATRPRAPIASITETALRLVPANF